MSFLQRLFGATSSERNDPPIWAEFAHDLGLNVHADMPAEEVLEALVDFNVVSVVDWADGPEMVLDSMSALFKNFPLSPDQVKRVSDEGYKAGKKGRGHAALPTICAIDSVLKGSGERLLWIDRGSDCYEMARVPDAIWHKWHDVKFGSDSVLAANMRNEYPRQRDLSRKPRQPRASVAAS